MDWLGLYLEEDIGSGDVTSEAIFQAETGGARLVARERAFVAGLAHVAELFSRAGCTTEFHMNDGSWVDAGVALATVRGPVRGLLTVERTALNLLGRMSGVATLTRELVEHLAKECSSAQVAATRKTTPGFRVFEKEAVAIAGGHPHRAGLHDAAMIKDNHRDAAGSVAAAVEAVLRAHPAVEITTEVESLADAQAAAGAGTHWILIDNQAPETGLSWATSLWADYPELKVEASGGITPATIHEYGWADRISLGALTRDARILDFGLDWGDS